MTASPHSRGILLLGASGSIGTQTLQVIEAHPQHFHLVGLSVHSNVAFGIQAARRHNVRYLIVTDEQAARNHSFDELPSTCRCLVGVDQINELIADPEVHTVVNAMVGSVGLAASYTALSTPHKRLALANKESLVVGGDLLMPCLEQTSSELIPIDSEHGALFQCLLGECQHEIRKMLITASGGPFYGYDAKRLRGVTKADALKHPTWNMGAKITIDSATLMNKGLEVIEAHHLFGVDVDDIEVVVHRQSIVHSMLEFIDGSIKAHLGTTDMRIPIQYALSYPARLDAPLPLKSIFEMTNLTFERPDTITFRCLDLAFEACRVKGTWPCVMNAANEVAVAAFLHDEITFVQIPHIVEETMHRIEPQAVSSIEQLILVDQEARLLARSLV